jgi:hypothetical protein
MRWDKLTLHKSLGGLDFRNMEAFNLSMLGKQSWKLLSDSSSLLTRILKAKYFPRRDFLDAPLGHNPSYTWRSLWSTQHLLTLGHRWKIGDGSRIKVWSTPWLRDLPTLKPSTPPLPNFEDLTVNHLMLPDLSSWNYNLVQSLFNPSDAAAILSTPLYNRRKDDTCIWKATVDGSYSVEMAYRICTDILSEALPQPNLTQWQLLWRFRVHPRVRAFLWRAAHHCLPTRDNLSKCGIPCSETCVSCDLLAESHMHLFFICHKAIAC